MSNTHRVSGLAANKTTPIATGTDNPIDVYHRRVMENPLYPIERYDEWALKNMGVTPETTPASVQDVKEKMESYVTSLGFGDYITDRNKAEVISAAQRRGVKVVTSTEGSQLQSILFDAIQRAIYADESESIQCIKVINYYINAYLPKLFSEGKRFSFADVMNKTPDEKTNFFNLIHLFASTCNPALRRRNLRRIDFQFIIDRLPTQQVRDNLTRAYADTYQV